MRTYFEKPRTTIGWKGLVYDPDLNNSYDINLGLRKARSLLLTLNTLGMPTATEFLNMITSQYFIDLISWGSIGARTTESQIHREFVSGLTFPVGFKNNTDGNLKIAIDALLAAKEPHHGLAVTHTGSSAIVSTKGNSNCHIILRGGKEPNYSTKHIEAAGAELIAAGLQQNLMIDFSHANSGKNYRRQIEVAENVAEQIKKLDRHIFGVMAESYLQEGRQDLKNNNCLKYGQSITDACIGWEDTLILLELLADAVKVRREKIKTSSLDTKKISGNFV
jgi:3-deoxy-7-phosphoheptulonate synthase